MEKNFLEIFNELLSENDLTTKSFSNKSGIPYPTVIGWTNLGRLPDFLALKKIADYFGCSVDYLMGRQREYGDPIVAAKLSAKEEKLIDDYRSLSQENKELIYKLAANLKESSD